MPALTFSPILFFLMVLPWLNPFTFGPSPAAAPLLFSWACALALLFFLTKPASLPHKAVAFKSQVFTVASAWWVAAVGSALIGLLQYFDATDALTPWVNSTRLGEAFANLRQRNQFATLCNIGLAALLWWVHQPVANGKAAAVWGEAGVLASAVLLQMGNAASSSRTGLLQLVLLLALFVGWGAWRQGRAQRVLIAAVLAYAASVLALPLLLGLDPLSSGMLARLQEGDALCSSRLTMWRNVLHLIAQKPWLGWGWGELDFAHFITLYSGPRFCEILDNAHNLPLQIAVELGVPVALACCILGAWAVWRGQPWRETDATRQMAWAVIAVIMLHSLLEYPLWYGPFQMAFGLGVGLLWRGASLRTESLKRISPFKPSFHPWAAAVFIALLMGGLSLAAWDYYRVSQVYLAPQDRLSAYRNNTLDKVSNSWLFQSQVEFAALAMLDRTPAHAAQVNRLAKAVLHFSPESQVIERVIESAELLGLTQEAAYYRARYQAAFPENYAEWVQGE